MDRGFRILPFVLIFGCASPAAAPVTDAERSRFLFMAVLEGLWEEGPDPAILKPLLDRPREHFVPKCPICTPVAHAIRVYVETPDVPVFDARGRGFPRELGEALRSPDRARRLKALEELVARYVDRRLRGLGGGEREEMRKYLDVGRQDGMALMEPDFGKVCPSCSGATRVR